MRIFWWFFPVPYPKFFNKRSIKLYFWEERVQSLCFSKVTKSSHMTKYVDGCFYCNLKKMTSPKGLSHYGCSFWQYFSDCCILYCAVVSIQNNRVHLFEINGWRWILSFLTSKLCWKWSYLTFRRDQ